MADSATAPSLFQREEADPCLLESLKKHRPTMLQTVSSNASD